MSPCALNATPCGAVTMPGAIVGLGLVGADFVRGVVGAETGDDFARLVEHGDAALDLADHGVVAVDGDGRGQEQVLGDDAEEFAIERHVDDAAIRAVAADDARRDRSAYRWRSCAAS